MPSSPTETAQSEPTTKSSDVPHNEPSTPEIGEPEEDEQEITGEEGEEGSSRSASTEEEESPLIKKGDKAFIIVIIGINVLAAVGLIYWIYSCIKDRKKSSEDSQEEEAQAPPELELV